jgi:hypothetical protein
MLGTVESPGRLGFFAFSVTIEFAFGVIVEPIVYNGKQYSHAWREVRQHAQFL